MASMVSRPDAVRCSANGTTALHQPGRLDSQIRQRACYRGTRVSSCMQLKRPLAARHPARRHLRHLPRRDVARLIRHPSRKLLLERADTVNGVAVLATILPTSANASFGLRRSSPPSVLFRTNITPPPRAWPMERSEGGRGSFPCVAEREAPRSTSLRDGAFPGVSGDSCCGAQDAANGSLEDAEVVGVSGVCWSRPRPQCPSGSLPPGAIDVALTVQMPLGSSSFSPVQRSTGRTPGFQSGS